MHRYIKPVDTLLKKISEIVLTCYQKTLSPDKGLLSPWLAGTICVHKPHCSQYARECLDTYGFFGSINPIIDRVLSCGPAMSISYDPSRYRVVFASGAPIGKEFLKQLTLDPRFDVVGVITMPDAPSGRGMKVKENCIATFAGELGMTSENIIKPQSLRVGSKKYANEAKAAIERITAKKVDYLVVIAYGKILPQQVLDIPAFGSINVHGSLLPYYRGASPLQSVFLHGEKETGVTIMYMDAGIDTGDIIDNKKVSLPVSWTVKELIQRIKHEVPTYLCDALRKFAKGMLDRIPQDHDKATHTYKITKPEGSIAFNDSLLLVYRKYQAYALWPKIHFLYHGIDFTIESLIVDESLREKHKLEDRLKDSSSLSLNPCIQSCQVKPSGKKTMSWQSFVNGYLRKV